MKFRVTFKTPDVLDDAIKDAVTDQMNAAGDVDPDKKEHVIESRCREVMNRMARWFRYGEYVRIEIDLDAGTVIVVPTKDQ